MNEVTTTNIDKFIELVLKGVECWYQAGVLCAAEIDKNPNFIEEVCKRCPELSEETVLMFERIGRKMVHPKLLIMDGPGPRKLRHLPYQLQEKYLAKPLKVLVQVNGKYESTNIGLMNLTTLQADQVFDGDKERNEAAQRAWIESRAMKKFAPPKRINDPYRIVHDKLVIMEPVTLTRREVADILCKMS